MAGFTPAMGIGQNWKCSKGEFNRGQSNLTRFRGDLVEKLMYMNDAKPNGLGVTRKVGRQAPGRIGGHEHYLHLQQG